MSDRRWERRKEKSNTCLFELINHQCFGFFWFLGGFFGGGGGVANGLITIVLLASNKILNVDCQFSPLCEQVSPSLSHSTSLSVFTAPLSKKSKCHKNNLKKETECLVCFKQPSNLFTNCGSVIMSLSPKYCHFQINQDLKVSSGHYIVKKK